MTKKDYIVIADAIVNWDIDIRDGLLYEGNPELHTLMDYMTNALKKDNNKFSQVKFNDYIHKEISNRK